jgi:Lon protease-like protein
VFEPRYLALVNDALAGGRIIGIVQPHAEAGDSESPVGRDVALRQIGGAGRITAFQETDDNRILISLSGIARFEITGEAGSDLPYRICSVDYTRFAHDFKQGTGEEDVDREHLLKVLKEYLTANDLSADWESIDRSPNELLVNTLSMISPYGPEEKQALLEADTLKRRAEVLTALAEMDIATSDSESGSTLQ